MTTSVTPSRKSIPSSRVAVEHVGPLRRCRRLWIDHQALDPVLGLATGLATWRWVIPLTHLGQRTPDIRFVVYAAVSTALLAVVTIGFTPLAIIVTLGFGANVRRLRINDVRIRRHYMLGTLVLLACAGALIGGGVADAGSRSDGGAQLAGCIAAGIGSWTTFRLVQIFVGILAADSRDHTA